MESDPINAYILMGHGEEPQVTVEEEQNFVPCQCKIKAKKKDITIGTRSNGGFMDLDSFFIVPNGCVIVVKAKPGEFSHSSVIHPLLNKIGSVENQELYRNPLSNTKELINQLGPVSIYKPGDKCPNFVYTLFDYTNNMKQHVITSHVGLLQTPLKTPIGLNHYNENNTLINSINETYAESVFPKKESVKYYLLRNILKREPTDTETTTLKTMMAVNKADCGKFIDFFANFYSVTQKQLLKIDDTGVAGRPGVYYNFICRYVNDPYYNRQAYDHTDKVNPAITSILQQPKSTQNLFHRVLNETVRQRTPYVRNSYIGGKRRTIKKRKTKKYRS